VREENQKTRHGLFKIECDAMKRELDPHRFEPATMKSFEPSPAVLPKKVRRLLRDVDIWREQQAGLAFAP
jgi:hypothetical protein